GDLGIDLRRSDVQQHEEGRERRDVLAGFASDRLSLDSASRSWRHRGSDDSPSCRWPNVARSRWKCQGACLGSNSAASTRKVAKLAVAGGIQGASLNNLVGPLQDGARDR